MMMGGSHKFSISPEEYVFAGLEHLLPNDEFCNQFSFQLLQFTLTLSTSSFIFWKYLVQESKPKKCSEDV